MVRSKMEIPDIKDAYIEELEEFLDERGSFYELLRDGEHRFVQQNVSKSHRRVLRGVHFQTENPQGKLVTCLQGAILDVFIDLREDSPTFLKSCSVLLLSSQKRSVYVPPGCGHSFLTLSHEAIVHYNCTSYYNKAYDAGIRWDSPELRPLYDLGFVEPIVSKKDANLPTLAEYLESRSKPRW